MRSVDLFLFRFAVMFGATQIYDFIISLLCKRMHAESNVKSSIKWNKTLPETSNLPSVFIFTECIPSDTRRISDLSSSAIKNRRKKKTLGKEI